MKPTGKEVSSSQTTGITACNTSRSCNLESRTSCLKPEHCRKFVNPGHKTALEVISIHLTVINATPSLASFTARLNACSSVSVHFTLN
jgi:hypothetical protein